MAKDPEMVEMDEKYRIEDDLRTLVRADEIRNDESRLKAAMKLAREQMAALKKVK